MSKRRLERGISELYRGDLARADDVVFGRAPAASRRGFLKGAGLAAMAAALGAQIPFAHKLPAGLIPVALGQGGAGLKLVGKEGLVVLSDRPINAETQAHMLDDEVTPASRLFIRDNGIEPSKASLDPRDWTLEITGDSCENPRTFSISDLKRRFKNYTYQLTLECGGNGRAEFVPAADGNQWTTGAVGCPRWTGVRLRDVLEHCGIKKDAVYVGFYGTDKHASGDPKQEAISRGVPITKALEDESLIAWAINEADMPIYNGHPLRLIFAGYPGSCSGKWLHKIVVRNERHDGEKMAPPSYSLPKHPVAPGTEVPEKPALWRTILKMPVKSLVTYPKSGIAHRLGKPLEVRGHAWASDLPVKEMFVSIDFGATWRRATLRNPVNRLAWQHFTTNVEFPLPGYYEIWARAVDSQGVSQPMLLPGWNPEGYNNNACHRIAVRAVA